jgi:hypothetical protein
VPGCAKVPEALREAGLHRRLAELGAEERGVVLPGRYADDAAPGSLRPVREPGQGGSPLGRAEKAGALLTDEPHDRPWGIYSGCFRDLDGHLRAPE